GDPEIASHAEWRNTARDDAWVAPSDGELLRAMDRFHAVPPSHAGSRFGPGSWAEWLYFNGHSADGSLRFYLTFLSPGSERAEARPVVVRLQLNRRGVTTNDTAAAEVDERALLATAPDIDVGDNHVRVAADGTYHMTLALPRAAGEIALTPAA